MRVPGAGGRRDCLPPAREGNRLPRRPTARWRAGFAIVQDIARTLFAIAAIIIAVVVMVFIPAAVRSIVG